MRPWISLLLLTVALAGCSGNDEPSAIGFTGTTEPPAPTVAPNTTTNSTTPPPPPPQQENRPPTATFAASPVSGIAPLRVNFTIEAEDADGDNLTWSLDVDGDGMADASGSEVPGAASLVFQDPGIHLANLTVSDGQNATYKQISIEVTVATAAGPFAVISTEWLLGATDLPGLPDYLECEAGPHDGVTHSLFALPAGSGGRTFSATLQASPAIAAVAEWGIYILAAQTCDGTDEAFYGEFPAPVGTGVDGKIMGTIPATADTVYAYASGGTDLKLTMVIG